jgi:hypothetical protein
LVSPEDDQMQHILEELLFEESEWTTPHRDRWDWGLPAPYSLSLPKLKCAVREILDGCIGMLKNW